LSAPNAFLPSLTTRSFTSIQSQPKLNFTARPLLFKPIQVPKAYFSTQERSDREVQDNDSERQGQSQEGEQSADSLIATNPRVYVGNLAYRIQVNELREHFAKAGTIVNASINKNEEGRSRGWGIVEFSSNDEAQKAIEELDQSKIGDHERNIVVRPDRVKNRSSFTPGEGRPRRTYDNNRSFGSGEENGERRRPSYNSAEGGAPRKFGEGDGMKVRRPNDEKKVLVKNLPEHYQWQHLKDLMSEAGEVNYAGFFQSQRSGRMGTVLFSDRASAERAVEALHDKEIDGQKIVVHLQIRDFP